MAEVVDGELVDKAASSIEHGTAQAGLAGVLLGFRGPGGWRIATEVEVGYEAGETYRHDLVGWRRERMPQLPVERPIGTRPDWVCEVLSRTNAATDTVKKLRTLQRHQVPHYWLLDPDAKTLRVLRWTEEGYLEALNATFDETVRAEPFQALEIDLAIVFGVD